MKACRGSFTYSLGMVFQNHLLQGSVSLNDAFKPSTELFYS